MFDLPKYGSGVCLARLARLLEALGVDRAQLQRNSIVVTGSNGKGSTAAFCASIGRAAGLRIGLFTSPHLYRFNERFQIDGTPIEDARLTAMIARIEAAIRAISPQLPDESFGAFEAQFALACLYFQEMECAFAVFEAGIGGRYDPVRLVGADITCVTSVDLEHVALLGNSLELISADKSDACAAGGTIIYGENCRKLRPHLDEYNRNRKVTGVFVRDEIAIEHETASAGVQHFDLRFDGHEFPALEIPMAGAFQLSNAAIAAALFWLWARRASPSQPIALQTAIRTGLIETRWPGRLELIRNDPLTVIDVGHTPDGITQALHGLKTTCGGSDWILVTGVSHDKKASEIVELLAPSFDAIICTAAHHKGSDPQTIAESAQHANPRAAVQVAATIEQAVALSTAQAAATHRKIFVAGGLFLAIEYAAIVNGERAQDLRFF
ncbi:MAG TPA: cyanophycin synthetase [Xanthobacteraceae bacterium]